MIGQPYIFLCINYLTNCSVSRDGLAKSVAPAELASTVETEPVSTPSHVTQRGEGGFKVSQVADYRNIFKKTFVVEYESDSPAFRKKVEALVRVYSTS